MHRDTVCHRKLRNIIQIQRFLIKFTYLNLYAEYLYIEIIFEATDMCYTLCYKRKRTKQFVTSNFPI